MIEFKRISNADSSNAREYQKIYKKQFKVDLDDKTLKKQLSYSKLYLVLKNGLPEGIIRIKDISKDDKYAKFVSKVKDALFISDMASRNPGSGVGHDVLIKLKNHNIVTVPWNDLAQRFYEKNNFSCDNIVDKNYPSVVCYKKKG